jgi:translocation and assembly module TamB
MRWLPILLTLAATPALAQDEPGFFERLFGTDTAESDTQQGTLLERLIEDSLSSAGRSVTVTGFRGALSGQATLESLTISDADGAWLTLTDATLDWSRAALFAGRLEVRELTAAEILLPRLATPPENEAPSPEAGRFQLPDLPVSLEIGRIAAERVELGEPVIGIAAELSLEGSFSLADGSGAADLAISRLDRPGAITLDAGFDNATENLRLDLSIQEEEGGILSTLAGLPGEPSVDFGITGEAPLSEFVADIRLATDGEDRLTGQVAVNETEEVRRIVTNLDGDIAPVFAPQFRDFFGNAVALEAETLLYADGRVVLPEFSLFAREFALFGSVELGADRLPRVIDITGRIAPETGETALLPVAGAETRVSRANFAVQFDAAQSEDWLTVIRLEDYARDGLAADEIALRATGRLTAGGQTAVSGDLDFDVSGLQSSDGLSQAIGSEISGNAQIDWAGGPLSIDGLSLRAKDLAVNGNATIDGDTVTTEVSLSADRIANFSTLAGRALSGSAQLDLSGRINPLTQAFDITTNGETIDLSIGEPRADAILAGTVALQAAAVRDTDGLRITLTTLESDAANLTGEASLRSGGSSAALNGRLNETSVILPGLNGPSDITFSGQEDDQRDWTIATSITAPALTANVSGLLGNIYDLPTFQGTVEADSPTLETFSELAGRRLSGQLSLRAEGGLNADLTRALVDATPRGRDISVEGLGVERLLQGPVTLEVRGGRTDDRVDIENLSFGGENLIAQLAGVVTDLTDTPRFEGNISANAPDLSVFSSLANRALSGRLNIVAEGAVRTDLSEARVAGTANGQDVAIGLAEVDRLLSGPLTLELDAARNGNRVDITSFSMRTDTISADTQGQLGSDGETLQLQARLADVSPFVPGFSGALSVDGSVGRQGETLNLDIDADGPGGSRANISGTLAQDASNASLDIEGTAPLALANRFISPRSLAGTSTFDLRLVGRPALENLSGVLALNNARLAAPTLPTGLDDITGTVALSNARAVVSLTSRVESGGQIAISGPVSLTSPNTAALRVDLTQVRLTDSRIYETTANGQIRIDGPVTGGAAITGSIALGETNIRIPSSGLGGAGAIPEITHINEPPPVRGTRRKAGLLDRAAEAGARGGPVFPLDVRISAPNRIFVRGRGLDSEFGGALRVTGTTANVIPIGAFELIRGRLDILGRRLDLEEARITIQGDLIPFLNIRANAQAEDTEINVTVIGPADSPEIRFSSSPELPQEEVIARLIFGRGLETLSPLQAARLALAVRTLAGQGGEGIVGNIRGTAGLADLDVTTNADGNTAVRAGAYLGENIYSDVTVDSEGETQLNLNLDVTPSLTVRGGVTNDGSSSLGIFFERDY